MFPRLKTTDGVYPFCFSGRMLRARVIALPKIALEAKSPEGSLTPGYVPSSSDSLHSSHRPRWWWASQPKRIHSSGKSNSRHPLPSKTKWGCDTQGLGLQEGMRSLVSWAGSWRLVLGRPFGAGDVFCVEHNLASGKLRKAKMGPKRSDQGCSVFCSMWA